MPTIKLAPEDWTSILVKIEQEYGQAARYISFDLRELGFQVRYHRFWNPYADYGLGKTVNEIHLDFDDNAMATHFRLKYL